jgi:hypothetical protein
MPTLDFFNADNMNLFWEYSKSLLSTAAPGVMIWFAIIGVGLLLSIIVKAWKDSAKDKDDDDIEFREY